MKCKRIPCSKEALPDMAYCSRECAPFSKLSNREGPKEKAALSADEITQFQKRARHVARKRGYPELAEDFAQEIFVAFGRGRRATIDQLFIDFLRQNKADPRTPGGRARQSANGRTDSLDESPSERPGGVLRHELVGGAGGDPESLLDHLGASHLFGGIEAQVYQLHFVEQLPKREIAEALLVSPSRISQITSEMAETIRDVRRFNHMMERYRDDRSSFGALELQGLEVEWVKI